MPLAERESYNFEIVVAYTLGQAIQLMDRGAINVRDAVILIDNLTNDVRGTRIRPSVTPGELIRRLNQLRAVLRRAGAKQTIICQIKPMRFKDVAPYNEKLSDYLRGQRQGIGHPTQVRHGHLSPDGFHVRPEYHWVIDKTYAGAMRIARPPQDSH